MPTMAQAGTSLDYAPPSQKMTNPTMGGSGTALAQTSPLPTSTMRRATLLQGRVQIPELAEKNQAEKEKITPKINTIKSMAATRQSHRIKRPLKYRRTYAEHISCKTWKGPRSTSVILIRKIYPLLSKKQMSK